MSLNSDEKSFKIHSTNKSIKFVLLITNRHFKSSETSQLNINRFYWLKKIDYLN
jgi:hypothetical protein